MFLKIIKYIYPYLLKIGNHDFLKSYWTIYSSFDILSYDFFDFPNLAENLKPQNYLIYLAFLPLCHAMD